MEKVGWSSILVAAMLFAFAVFSRRAAAGESPSYRLSGEHRFWSSRRGGHEDVS